MADVIAPIPFPLTKPVMVFAPVPPFTTLSAVVKLNVLALIEVPTFKEVPIIPAPLILKFALVCCVVPFQI